jgi:hypothetical protein
MRLWGALLGLLGLLLSLQCELRIVGCGRVRPRTIHLVLLLLLPGLTGSDLHSWMADPCPLGYTPRGNTGLRRCWCCTWWSLRTWVLRLVGNVVGRRLIVSMVTKMLWLILYSLVMPLDRWIVDIEILMGIARPHLVR